MTVEMSPEYRESLRKTSGEQKLRTSFSLYWGARKLKAARLREQNPNWSEEEIAREVREIFMYASS